MKKRIIYLSLTILLISCGHYQTAEYVPQSEYSKPEEFMSDKVVDRPDGKLVRGAFRLQWPVSKMDISRGYISGGRKEHHGIDLRGHRNDPILAAHEGTVIYAGSGFRGYGKMAIIEYDGHWASLYGHMNILNVKTGQEVKTGDKIGGMGRTGRATGVHLHFELLKNKLPIDPMPLFAEQGLVAGMFNALAL